MSTITEVLTPEELKVSNNWEAYQLQTCYFQNQGTHFEIGKLPVQFQFAPIFSLVAVDIDRDGNLDLMSAGNLSATRARTGKLTGNYGVVASGDGRGNFKALSSSQTGIAMKGDVRHMSVDKGDLIVAINNKGVIRYKWKFNKNEN